MTEPAAPDIVTSSHRNQTDWNEARVERLKQLVADGLSASQIGAEFGVSRNAIIGKVHRLRLMLRNGQGGSTGRDPDKPRKTRTARVSPTSIHAIRASARYKRGLHEPWVQPEMPPLDPATAVNFDDLREHHCRWPHGENGTMLFCGSERINSLFSYCAAHCQIAYIAPNQRRR